MKNNRVAPHPYRIFWLMLFLIGPLLMVSSDSAHSEMVMNELSEIQDAVFHLSPRSYTFDAESYKADQYIDLDQAEFFIWAAEPPKNLEADGNYPYRVVDHNVRDNDLEITLSYACAGCPSQHRLYLSRDDIFKSEYIDRSFPLAPPDDRRYRHHFRETKHKKPGYQKRMNPPRFFEGAYDVREPFHHQRVEMVYFGYDREIDKSEALHRSPDGSDLNGYMEGAYIHAKGCVTVWVGETHFFDRCSFESKEPEYTGRCDCSPKKLTQPAKHRRDEYLEKWNFPVCPIERKEPPFTGRCGCSGN